MRMELCRPGSRELLGGNTTSVHGLLGCARVRAANRTNLSRLVVAGGLVLGLETQASACEVLQRDVLPENASVLLSSACEAADAVITVDIDGTPARLVPAALQQDVAYSGFMDIDPQPAQGQQIRISIDGTIFGLVVGEPDNTAPTLEDVEIRLSGNPPCPMCPQGQGPSGSVISVSWFDAALDGSTIYAVELIADGEVQPPVFAGGDRIGNAPPDAIGLSTSKEVAEVCAAITATDASGNTDVFESTCVDDNQGSGCGCTSGQGPGWGMLCLLGLVARPRRSRTRGW